MVSFLTFATILQQAVKTHQLYGPLHPRTRTSIEHLMDAFQHHLSGRPYIQVAARNGRLYVDRVMEEGLNLQLKALIERFEEHGIHALVVYASATGEEWASLAELLTLKPTQVRADGGARAWLEQRHVRGIRILATRLEDVSETGEVAAALLTAIAEPLLEGKADGGADGLRSLLAKALVAGQATPTQPSLPASLSARHVGTSLDTDVHANEVRSHLLHLLTGGVVPDLSHFGDFLGEHGLDRQGASPGTQGVIAKAMGTLPAEGRLGVLMGAAHLRSGSLRTLFARLAAQGAVSSIGEVVAKGNLSTDDVPAVMEELKPLMPVPEHWEHALAEAMVHSGMDGSQVRELMEVLTWDKLSVEERLSQLLDEGKLDVLPIKKVIAFLRELLERGRIADFLRLLQRLGEDLHVPVVERRHVVAEAFVQIARWVEAPGLPEGARTVLVEILVRAWNEERDPEVHGWSSQALEHLLWHLAARGRGSEAVALFGRLSKDPDMPWREAAAGELLLRLASPGRLAHLLTQLHGMERGQAAERIHPVLRLMGTPAADYVLEHLAEEPDRGRRARLLEALKSCGQTAEGPLLEALHAAEWFVVRNALIVLGEVGSSSHLPQIQPLLGHRDGRVQRAAVRTLSRIGGQGAEAMILPLLTQEDPETQLEVIFAIQEQGTKRALPALLELVKRPAKRPEQARVREKAIDVVGLLGSPSAVPLLVELLARHRGFFGERREALGLRLAALKALLALNHSDAQGEVARVLEKEPPGPEREALEAAVLKGMEGA